MKYAIFSLIAVCGLVGCQGNDKKVSIISFEKPSINDSRDKAVFLEPPNITRARADLSGTVLRFTDGTSRQLGSEELKSLKISNCKSDNQYANVDVSLYSDMYSTRGLIRKVTIREEITGSFRMYYHKDSTSDRWIYNGFEGSNLKRTLTQN